jgi:hypothetical protein
MTDIEAKALALVNDCGGDVLVVVRNGNAWVEALCRAIEQHEAFKQKVSDALKIARADVIEIVGEATTKLRIANIDKHECKDAVWAAYDQAAVDCYNEIRAALEARGFEIREKGQ